MRYCAVMGYLEKQDKKHTIMWRVKLQVLGKSPCFSRYRDKCLMKGKSLEAVVENN